MFTNPMCTNTVTGNEIPKVAITRRQSKGVQGIDDYYTGDRNRKM